MGLNQDRRVLKSAVFRLEWDHRNGPSHKCQRQRGARSCRV